MIEQNQHLAFSWRHVKTTADGNQEATPLSQVQVHFKAAGGGTLVSLRHASIVAESSRLNVHKGWSVCFANLYQQLTPANMERGEPQSMR